jgi:hypothetical protein
MFHLIISIIATAYQHCQGWDILWSHFQTHYGIPCLLKFYQSGHTHHILSETGTQQGETLGTVLFAASISLIFPRVADSHADILVFAFANIA